MVCSIGFLGCSAHCYNSRMWDIYRPALKPGQVIQVRPCLKIIRVWRGLDHVQREIKKYVIWRCNNADIPSLRAMPTFVTATHFCIHMHVCMYKIWLFTGLHRAMPIDRLLLQARECYPCSMSGLLLCKARALGLCNATPTFSKHILVPVNLLEPHIALCTTPTDPSLYLLVIADICVVTYPQYANSNVRLGFSYPGHQVIRVSSCDLVSMLLYRPCAC